MSAPINLLTLLETLPGSYAGPARPDEAPYGLVGVGEGTLAAAIALTLRQRKDSRSQNVGEQVRVKKADRLRVVKVAPQVEAPAAAQQEEGGQA